MKKQPRRPHGSTSDGSASNGSVRPAGAEGPARAQRPAALVVIDRRRGDHATAALLEKVAGAASRQDRLVLLDSSGQPLAAGVTKRVRGLQSITVERDGWIDGLRGLLAEHDGPVCIVETAAAPVGNRWLDELLAPLGEGASVCLPASNAAPFPSCPADAPDANASTVELRRFAQQCRDAHPANRTATALHGPVACFAAGVLDKLGATAMSLRDLDVEGLDLIEVPSVYVHATDDVPQVSVCLIMKDETVDLADCIASLRPIADEIVIYDTGSTDGSVELARSLGAVVIEGEWRNDFAWARNQALAAARGTWVLSIDPDERLEFDHGTLPEIRGLLGDNPPVDRFIIELFDLQGSVHAPVRSGAGVPMARLFRRQACRWVGALHEQPDARPGKPALRSIALPGVRFLHRGYLDEIVRDKDKWARNLEVATAGLDKIPDSDKECFDLGRSLRSVGEGGRAFTLFERAADLAQNVVITRGALEFAVLTLCENGQADQSEPYLERLRALDGGAGPARYLEGWVHVQLHRWDEARQCFEGITDYDDNFTGFRAESVSLALALAYRGLGRREDATRAAVEALQRNDQAMEAWAVLFDTSEPGADTDREVAASIAPDRLMPLFARLADFPASARDRLADALWQIRPGDRIVLAVASQIAESLELGRSLVWSSRLRTNGLGVLCPLTKVADDGSKTVAERAAILARGLHELDAADVAADLERLVGLLHDEEAAELLAESLAAWPGAAGSIIVAAATTPLRCLRIVELLTDHGFGDEALAVFAHGADLDGDGTRKLLEARPALAHTLRQTADAAGRDDLDQVLPSAA